MSFLNPLMLIGISAISIPIIIHLLNRRKFQRVIWAAMRFLKTSVQQNQRRIHLEDILLLIMRCLLIAIIVLTLARPAIKSSATGILGAKTTSIIILDNSYSMSASDGTSDWFTRGQNVAYEIISNMQPGSSSALFLASDIVRPVIPEPTYDVNLLRKAIKEARVCGRTSDLLPLIKQAVEMLKVRPAIRREIYTITDGQSLAWKNMKEIQNLFAEAKKENIQVSIILVGEPQERNLGINRFSVASGLCPVNQPIRFEVQVNNYGEVEEKDIKVNLSVDDNPPCDEVVIDNIPSGTSKTVSLFAKFYKDGFHSLNSKITGDRLPADDTLSLAIKTVKEVRILLVDGNPGAEAREGQAFFLKNAIQPVPPAEAPQYFLKPTVVYVKDLTNIKFDDFDVVFLLDVSELSDQTINALDYFVNRGGGLVIFPGPLTASRYYNNVLFDKFSLLPAKLGNIKGDYNNRELFFSFQSKDYNHPIVEIWNDPSSGTLSSAKFYAAYDLLVPQNNSNSVANTRIILNYNDGKPAIVEKAKGFGRVVLFSSTANTFWNDLPVRPAFVPLIHRLIGSITTRQFENLTLRVGDTFIYRVDKESLGKDVVIIPPGISTNSPRGLRRVELLNDLPAIQYDETDFSGVYEVLMEGNVHKVIKFAVQFNPIESNLNFLSKPQLDLISQYTYLLHWRQGVSIRDEIQKNRFGIELGMPFALMALLIAITESALAQYFSKTK